MKKSGLLAFMMCVALVVDMTCYAQQPVGIVATNSPTPYGSPITLDEARSVMEAAVAEAKRINWFGAIAIVGPPGDLIYYQKLDNAGYSMAAQGKAYTAATYRRPTKVFQEALAAGNNVFLEFPWIGRVGGRHSNHDKWQDRRGDWGKWGDRARRWLGGDGRSPCAQVVRDSWGSPRRLPPRSEST